MSVNFIVGDTGSGMSVTYEASEPRYTVKATGAMNIPDAVLGQLYTVNNFQVSRNATITVTPIEGYEITSAVNNSGTELDFSTGSIQVVLGWSSYYKGGDYSMIITAEPIGGGEGEEIVVTNNYQTTINEYQDFQSQVYNIESVESSSDGSGSELSQFLVSTKIYPFTISENDVSGRESIHIRDQILTESNKIDSNTITLDLGNFSVPSQHNNALDFFQVNVYLYLPFNAGSISIPAKKVIGKNINVSLSVIITTGNTTINVRDLDSDELIVIQTSSIGSDMPFYNKYDVNNSTYNPNEITNNMGVAYLSIETPIYSGERILTGRKGLLDSVNGYVEITRIQLDSLNATNDEKDMINDLLERGVFIK